MSSALMLKHARDIPRQIIGRCCSTKIIRKTSQASQNISDVPGLSANVVQVATEPVGPGASKSSENYKNPEYFCYDKASYFEAEIEMQNFRCPQPSNKEYFKP